MIKRNVRFGFAWLLLFAVMGAILEAWLGINNWQVDEILRATLRSAHSHALCFAFINILFGLAATSFIKSKKWQNLASWFLIAGGFLYPAGLLAEVFIAEPLVYLAPVGGILVILGLLVAGMGDILKK